MEGEGTGYFDFAGTGLMRCDGVRELGFKEQKEGREGEAKTMTITNDVASMTKLYFYGRAGPRQPANK